MFNPSKLLTVDNFYEKSTTVKPFDPSDPDLNFRINFNDGNHSIANARFRYQHVADMVRQTHITANPFDLSSFTPRKNNWNVPFGGVGDRVIRDNIITLIDGFKGGDWSVMHTLLRTHNAVAQQQYIYRPELQDMYILDDEQIRGFVSGRPYFNGDVSHEAGQYTRRFLFMVQELHNAHDQYLAEQKKIKVNEAIALFEKEPHLFRPKAEAENKAQFDIKNLALIGGLGLATYLLISDKSQPKEELKIVVHDQS